MLKKVILTGASDGLGLEIAKELIQKGIVVIGISRTKPKLDIEHIPCDLTDKNDIEKLIKKIEKDHTDIDCLINCAGMIDLVNPENIKYKNTEKVFKLNIIAPIILSSKLLNLIKQNHGDIINVASTIAFKAYESQAAYVGSKWGIRGLNEYLRLELKGTKCRVIGFNPGGLQTKFFEKVTNEKKDLSAYIDPSDMAKFLVQILELPKTMEVSDVIINRK